jgi:hypothetical protein
MTFSDSVCEIEMESPLPEVRTVLCTIVIIVFTIALEVTVASKLGCCSSARHNSDSAPTQDAPTTTLAQPQSEPPLQAAVQVRQGPAPPSANKKRSLPSPLLRANRLAAAVLLFVPLVIAFSLRMADIVTPPVPPTCRHRYGSGNMPPPNWWAVALLNILPFVSACFALLRALVDALLVRWNTGLSPIRGGQIDGEFLWMPCMPFMLVGVLGYMVLQFIRWLITVMMGQPGSDIWGRERVKEGDADVEMQGDRVNLMDDMDDMDGNESVEGNVAGLPTYDEVVGVGPGDKV